jgi:uncharacterized protein YegJ (DUF2314 family)
MSEPVFIFNDHDPEMQYAYQAAQSSFRYFWRELSWERRRIVPGLGMTMVKLPFTDGPRTDGNSEYEYMWIEDIDFDGDLISGTLLNSPNWLTSVNKGDVVSVPFSHLTDWMMTANDRGYGGFTVNLMRSRMDPRERDQHDQAWGLDFGNPTDIQVEIHRKAKPKAGLIAGLLGRDSQLHCAPEGFSDHPMCINMIPNIEAQLQNDPRIANMIDDNGWTLLHHEALAGNQEIVRLLMAFGADLAARTPNGYTASDLARKIGWSEITALIQP